MHVGGAAEGFEGGGVLFAGEAGEDALAEGGPGGNGEDFTAEVDGGGPEGVAIRAGAEEEAGEAGDGFVASGVIWLRYRRLVGGGDGGRLRATWRRRRANRGGL